MTKPCSEASCNDIPKVHFCSANLADAIVFACFDQNLRLPIQFYTLQGMRKIREKEDDSEHYYKYSNRW